MMGARAIGAWDSLGGKSSGFDRPARGEGAKVGIIKGPKGAREVRRASEGAQPPALASLLLRCGGGGVHMTRHDPQFWSYLTGREIWLVPAAEQRQYHSY